MVYYGQNQEDKKVLEYFGDFVGNFLDIGSFTGIELSNVRNLALRGWRGLMVEPSPTVFPVLQENYKDLPNVHCLSVAVGEVDGESILFYNPNCVATLVGTETQRWNGREAFNKVRVPVVTFNRLYREHPGQYQFISIDCEGLDYAVLKQIDLDRVGCRMIIIEWNSKARLKTEIVDYVEKYHLKLVGQNPENLIFTK
jgi:FkbM family methyltransferase